jgi:hypothetical protein
MPALRAGLLGLGPVVAVTGCVFPGSSSGRIAVRGLLLDEAKQPLADREVQVILPAAYGLGAVDLVLNEPADFGKQDHVVTAVTDAKGEFFLDLGVHVYHRNVWLLPPLGTAGRP